MIELINTLAVVTSFVSTVFLLQERFMTSSHLSTLSKLDMTVFRGLVASVSSAQLFTLLTPASVPITALNVLLALTKLFLIKKF